MVDHLGQMLAQAREQIVARQAGLRHQAIDLIGAQRIGKIVRRNLLVRARADPGIGGFAMTILLELLEQVAKSAADHASRGTACEQAAQSTQSTREETAEPAAAGWAGIRGVA